MGHTFGHSGSGSALQFASAAADDLQGERVEPAYCVRCGRMHFRKAVEHQKTAPPAVCPRCVQAQAQQASREVSSAAAARRQVVRTLAVN